MKSTSERSALRVKTVFTVSACLRVKCRPKPPWVANPLFFSILKGCSGDFTVKKKKTHLLQHRPGCSRRRVALLKEAPCVMSRLHAYSLRRCFFPDGDTSVREHGNAFCRIDVPLFPSHQNQPQTMWGWGESIENVDKPFFLSVWNCE